jgi:formylglycine-generating enzyme required for sulfatase activity
VQSYLNRYPAGRFVAAANAKLKLIKEEEAKGPAMVRIPGKNYELGKYEVTQKEWRDVMGSNPSNFSSCGDNCPVEQVSWDDIQTFLQKLNAKTGRQYRLPTEAEWEYACYGGSQTEYCGSNDIDSVAWHGNNEKPGGNSNQTTHPAGQKQANGYGLYDMSGNVWEFQSDCLEGDCAARVLRGGSWFNAPQFARAASRRGFEPARRSLDYGFRLARMLP